jgi:nitric oxide reductase subunit B
MCTAMMLIGLFFGVAGVIQSYVERAMGMGYMTAQSYMRLWMGAVFFCGFAFLAGVLLTAADLLTIRPAKVRA